MLVSVRERVEKVEDTNIIAGNDSLLSILFLGLPPSSTDVRDFEDLVLGERNLVAIVRVRFVAVDRLRSVRVVELCLLLALGDAGAGGGWTGSGGWLREC